MRPHNILGGLLLAGLTSACGHDHGDEKEWTKEELEELEARWGYEVRLILQQTS